VLKFHNNEFYNALFNLSKVVKEKIDTPDRQSILTRKFKIVAADKPTWAEIGEDYERAIVANSSEIYKLDEFKKCISIIQSDTQLQSHFNQLIRVQRVQKIVFDHHTLLYIIAKLMEHSRTKEINLSYFRNLYRDFESFIYHTDPLYCSFNVIQI
jgi:hypothetical protein